MEVEKRNSDVRYDENGPQINAFMSKRDCNFMASKPHVPGFVLAERLGSGSYAVVYKAFSKEARRDVVAVKCVKKSSLTKPATENLLTEISILKKLKHEHIVEMRDFLWDDSHIYLIMEYCSGGDLSTFVKTRRTLPERVVKCFLQQLATALQYLRSQNIAHLDLKPQNILLTSKSDPKLKLADFGFAQYLRTQDDSTSLRGSPLYMAPEILLHKKYDARVDLWSVGVILYECMFGRAPYSSQSFAELAQKIMNPKRIELPYGVDISMACRDLLMRLLERDPDDRITFEEFFTHPFVDLDHMPSAESYVKAVTMVAEAVDKDSNKEYGAALKLYCQALQHFVPAISYETSPDRKATMREKAKEYLSRAEELKNIIKPKQDGDFQDSVLSPLEELVILSACEPHLQAALKVANAAEQLENLEQYEAAIEKYQLALGNLLPILSSEPKGKRKELLHFQVQRWLSKAEHIKDYLAVSCTLPIEETIRGDAARDMGESLRQQCCIQ